MQGLEGYAFAGEGEIGVVLRYSYYTRIKRRRSCKRNNFKDSKHEKRKGFEVADKIKLYVANNEMLIDVIKKFEETIKKETLTCRNYL